MNSVVVNQSGWGNIFALVGACSTLMKNGTGGTMYGAHVDPVEGGGTLGGEHYKKTMYKGLFMGCCKRNLPRGGP